MADEQADAGAAGGNPAQDAMEQGNAVRLQLIDQAEAATRETFAALRAAAQAKDVGEVMKIQSDYLRAQTERNMQNAREMGELILRYGREAVAPFTGTKS